MKKVYLIRHALPDFPEGKRMCIGVTDISIGKVGLAQAAEMARKLPPVTAVFSSPLRRAVQTAAAIGMQITILDDLRELNAGEWDGLTFDQIQALYPELYAARGQDPAIRSEMGVPAHFGGGSGILLHDRGFLRLDAGHQLAVLSAHPERFHRGILQKFFRSCGDAVYPAVCKSPQTALGGIYPGGDGAVAERGFCSGGEERCAGGLIRAGNVGTVCLFLLFWYEFLIIKLSQPNREEFA
jgi:hypothetical protein